MISFGFTSKALGVTFGLLAVVATSCGAAPATDTAGRSSAAPVTTSPFPYPPIEYSWDAAVPLTAQQKAAGEVAFKKIALTRKWRRTPNPTLPPELLAIVSPENQPAYTATLAMAETGSSLHRIVAVREMSPTRWEFDFCEFDTPGRYSMGDNGQLQLSTPDIVSSAETHIVSLTTEPNGAGERSETPRFLVVGLRGIINEMVRQTCEPFLPDPAIQQPPEPLPAEK